MLEVCSQDAPISWEDAYALLQQFASSLMELSRKCSSSPRLYLQALGSGEDYRVAV